MNKINHIISLIIPILSILIFIRNIFFKSKKTRGFQIYLFSLATLFYLNMNINYKSLSDLNKIQTVIAHESRNTIFSIIEFLTFSSYIIQQIESTRIKKINLILTAVFLITYISIVTNLIYTTNNEIKFSKLSFLINHIEFLIIILSCLYYFNDYFKRDAFKANLPTSPLLIIGSTFLYTSVSLPFLVFTPDYTTVIFKMLTTLHYTSLICILLSILYASVFQNKNS